MGFIVNKIAWEICIQTLYFPLSILIPTVGSHTSYSVTDVYGTKTGEDVSVSKVNEPRDGHPENRRSIRRQVETSPPPPLPPTLESK